MEKGFRLRYFYYELIRNLKYVIIFTIIGTVLSAGFCVYSIKKPNDTKFCSFGELLISNYKVINSDNESDEQKKLNEVYTSIIESDSVLEDVLIGLSDSEAITINDLRDNIYISAKSEQVIRINVVMDNQELAQTIADLLIEESKDYFNDRNYHTEILRDATEMGEVVVNINEGEAYIQVASQDRLEVLVFLKYIIAGALLGAVLVYAMCILAFIFKGKLWYKEQINDDLNLKVLGCIDKEKPTDIKRIILSILGILATENKEKNIVNFIHLTDKYQYSGFIEQFIREFPLNGGRLLIINVIKDVEKKSILKSRVNEIDIMTIEEMEIIGQKKLDKILNDVSGKYDYIFCFGGKLGQMQSVYYANIVDTNFVVVEAGVAEITQTYNELNMYTEKQIDISGAILIN